MGYSRCYISSVQLHSWETTLTRLHPPNGQGRVARLDNGYQPYTIVRELLNHIPRNSYPRRDADVVCREHAQRAGEYLRPDLVLYDKRDQVVVVDVVCPFDNGVASVAHAEDRKCSKREELCNSVQSATGRQVELHTFVVGSHRSYAEGSATTLSA